jgi:predicted O-methyltransferase YrrM
MTNLRRMTHSHQILGMTIYREALVSMNQFKEAVEQIRKEPIWDFNPAAGSTIGEHYALLAVVAREPQVKTIVDIGTWAGTGFLSFRAGNPNVNVQTFDIFPRELFQPYFLVMV